MQSKYRAQSGFFENTGQYYVVVPENILENFDCSIQVGSWAESKKNWLFVCGSQAESGNSQLLDADPWAESKKNGSMIKSEKGNNSVKFWQNLMKS